MHSSASASIDDGRPDPIAIDGVVAIDIPGGNDEDDAVARSAMPPATVEAEGGGKESTAQHGGAFSMSRALSALSKQFDVNGDGKLDDAELVMRSMATSGRGFLTNEQVYSIVVRQMDDQRKLFRTRRIAFVLLGLVFALALSNLGTSFAAAYLSKDVVTSGEGVLESRETSESISTQTYAETIDLESTVQITTTPSSTDGAVRRRLCTVDDDDDVECMIDSLRTLGPKKCDTLIDHCRRGNTVNLKRVWKNGDVSMYNICRFSSGTISQSGTSRLKNAEGATYVIERLPGEYCGISGDAVSQGLGDVCEKGRDCATGLICSKDDAIVEACRDRCDMLRFAPSMLPACYARCDISSCGVAVE